MFSKFDMLGERLTFFHNDYERIKTNFGGILTLFISLILGLLIFGFGRDFFKRANPSTTKSTETIKVASTFNITNQEFSFAARLEDNIGNPLDISTLFEINYQYILLKKDESGTFVEVENDFVFAPCEKDDFFPSDFANRKDINTFICPKLNGYPVGGSETDEEVVYLEFYVKPCREGTTNSKGDACGTRQEKIDMTYGPTFVAFYYQRSIVDPNDYNKGIQRIIENFYFPIDTHLYTRISLSFYETILKTDYGWMLEEVKTLSFLGLSKYTQALTYFDDLFEGGFDYGVAGVGIIFQKERDIYTRIYPKIQTLVAQVGGILKIFLLAGYTIVSRFNLHYIQLKYSDLIQKANTNDDNNKQKRDSINEIANNCNSNNINSEIPNNINVSGIKNMDTINAVTKLSKINKSNFELINTSKNYINPNNQNVSISRFHNNLHNDSQYDSKNIIAEPQSNSVLVSSKLEEINKTSLIKKIDSEEKHDCKCSHIKIGSKSIQFLRNLEKKLQSSENQAQVEKDTKKEENVGFFRIVDMSLNLAIYLTSLTCCLSTDKLKNFRTVEKRFNSKLNVEFIVPKILMFEKYLNNIFGQQIMKLIEGENF